MSFQVAPRHAIPRRRAACLQAAHMFGTCHLTSILLQCTGPLDACRRSASSPIAPDGHADGASGGCSATCCAHSCRRLPRIMLPLCALRFVPKREIMLWVCATPRERRQNAWHISWRLPLLALLVCPMALGCQLPFNVFQCEDGGFHGGCTRTPRPG